MRKRWRGPGKGSTPGFEFSKQPPQKESLLSVTAIFVGCRKDLIDHARGKNNQHNFLSIDDFDTLLHLMNTIKSTERLPIVMVGPHVSSSKGAESQVEAITRLKKEHRDLTVIAVREDDLQNGGKLKVSKSIAPSSHISGEIVLSKKEGTPLDEFDVVEFGEEARQSSSPGMQEVHDVLELRDAGASRIVSAEDLRDDPESLVTEIAKAAKRKDDVKPIICRVRNGIVEEVTPRMIAKSKETIDEFSGPYNNHMRLTGHFDAMFEAYRMMLLKAGQKLLGNRIIDLGCGTGYPMAMLIGRVIIPQLRAAEELRGQISRGEQIYVKQFREIDRGETRILSVDRSVGMLAQAKKQFDSLKRREGILEGKLTNAFLSEDIWNLTPEILAQDGFQHPSTIIVSMLIHWQPTRQKDAFVRQVASLMPEGATYIAIEEWPQTINPSPFLDPALMKKIEKSLRPLRMETYYEMLRGNGLSDIPDAEAAIAIDKEHGYYIKAFVK